MKIAICSSMVFAEKMLEAKETLEKRGHEVFVSEFADTHIGKTDEEKEELAIVQKNEKDAIRKHWEKIRESDAILVLNYDKRGIRNYIGGNTLMEIGFAHVLDKKIFLLKPVPEIQYRSEIEAVKPIIINGELEKIR